MPDITSITAVDWVHATQGNASADIANTYLLLKLQYSDSSIDIADMYMTQFCAATDTKKSYVTAGFLLLPPQEWQKTNHDEKELLELG